MLHKHEKNKGKGAALRTAVSLATGTHILPFDADLEYTPKDIPRLVEPILTGRFDVVYGTRLFGYNTVYQSFRYAVGNKVLTTMTNILFDSFLSDLHTCLKLMPLDLFRSLDLREKGFGLDTELTATLLRLGVRPFEVPVSYYSRSHARGQEDQRRRRGRLPAHPVPGAHQAQEQADEAGGRSGPGRRPRPRPAEPRAQGGQRGQVEASQAARVEAPVALEAAGSAEPDDAAKPESVPVLNGLASRV